MASMTALPSIEVTFAEQNLHILNEFAGDLDAELYDAAMTGYLKGVVDYLSDPELMEKYKFRTIAIRRMRTSLKDHKRAVRRRMEAIKILSFEALPAEPMTGEQSDTLGRFDDGIKMVLLLEALNKRLGPQEMTIVNLCLFGYSHRDIAQKLHLTVAKTKELIEGMRDAVYEVCRP